MTFYKYRRVPHAWLTDGARAQPLFNMSIRPGCVLRSRAAGMTWMRRETRKRHWSTFGSTPSASCYWISICRASVGYGRAAGFAPPRHMPAL
jgi:hypothetical protein